MILEPYDYLGESQVSMKYSRAFRRTRVLLDKGEQRARPFLESYSKNTRMNVICEKIYHKKIGKESLYYTVNKAFILSLLFLYN